MTEKIYGPYKRKSDGRWIIIVDGTTISYPRYVYEKYHNCTIAYGYEVDHKDDNPDNNHIDNLQLMTKTDNIKKAAALYISPKGWTQSEEHKRSGAKNGMARLTQEQVNVYRKLTVIPGLTVPRIMAETGLSKRAVENMLKKRSYK